MDTDIGYAVPNEVSVDMSCNIDTVKIIVGEEIVSNEILEWEEYEFEREEGYEESYNPDFKGKRISLGEIYRQLTAKGIEGVIYVWVESPLRGVIYQCGNYEPGEWVKHGTTKGYA